jgi:hypothetical protein
MGGMERTAETELFGQPILRTFRAWPILAVTVIVWSYIFLVVADGRYYGDLRGFLCLGESIRHPSVLDSAPKTSRDGYDGQFYVALATDPFMRKHETTSSLDNTAFRGSRIMIPLFAWAVSLGHAGAAVYAYQLLCWALGIAAVFMVARMLAEEGQSPAWAFLLIPSGGLAASLLRTTPDAGTVAFVLAALWFQRQGRFAAALTFSVAAFMTREISVLLLVALALDEILKRKFLRSVAFLAVPAVVWSGWKVYMQLWLGQSRSTGEHLFAAPFSWVARKASEIVQGGVADSRLEMLGALALIASLVGGAAVLSKRPRWTAVDFTFVGFSLLIPFLSYSVYIEAWGFTRILMILPFLALLAAERRTSPWRRWSLRSVAAVYALVGIVMIAGEFRAATHGRGLGRATISALTHLVSPSTRPRPDKRRRPPDTSAIPRAQENPK